MGQKIRAKGPQIYTQDSMIRFCWAISTHIQLAIFQGPKPFGWLPDSATRQPCQCNLPSRKYVLYEQPQHELSFCNLFIVIRYLSLCMCKKNIHLHLYALLPFIQDSESMICVVV
jgi:hypothetical protein